MTHVRHWNADKIRIGQRILVYTLGNGSMYDAPRKRGYVVQKYSEQGGERSKFHLNAIDALADYTSDKF